MSHNPESDRRQKTGTAPSIDLRIAHITNKKNPRLEAFLLSYPLLLSRQHALKNSIAIYQQMLECCKNVDNNKRNQECCGYPVNALQEVVDYLVLRSHRRNLEKAKKNHAILRKLSGGKS